MYFSHQNFGKPESVFAAHESIKTVIGPRKNRRNREDSFNKSSRKETSLKAIWIKSQVNNFVQVESVWNQTQIVQFNEIKTSVPTQIDAPWVTTSLFQPERLCSTFYVISNSRDTFALTLLQKFISYPLGQWRNHVQSTLVIRSNPEESREFLI